MNFDKRYQGLNDTQRLAVDHIEGPLLVVAGPGSGKTEILGIRAGNILKKTDTPPESILCLTYTETASSNMKERLIDLIGEDGHKVPVHTFHGFCKKIMESYPEYFLKGSFFNVADDATKTGILSDILDDLDYKDPLYGIHPKKGHIYLNAVKEGITQLKESGLTVSEFREVIKKNREFFEKSKEDVDEVFGERVSKEIFSKIRDLVQKFREEDRFILSHVKSFPHVIADSLEGPLATGDTTEISGWKGLWTKNVGGKRVFKNFPDIEKMESLADIYEKYKNKMYDEGYYEFLDMLLDVAVEIENNGVLKSELQEKYLYFLVDEFQDTNGIQMRILNLLAEDEKDKKPNICVVGDDDQAIYKFQGAEISNILNFKERYPSTEIITLVKSYRSEQKILDLARKVILKGEKRLENLVEKIDKNIVSEIGSGGDVVCKTFRTKEEEFTFIARSVKERLEMGVDPEEIAVIGRTHKTLREIGHFFSRLEIPTYSERKENVLEKEHVRQIITIIKFASLFLEGDRKTAEELLPEILSYPFWKIPRKKILDISVKSYIERKSWLVCMEEENLSSVAEFLLDFSVKAKSKSLEEMVDIIINSQRAPFKEFYFSKENFQKRKSDYLDFLSSLKRFVKGVKDFRAGKFIKAKDLPGFLEIYEKNEIPMLNKNPLVLEEGAVPLMTAHNVKGKEFDTVFILNCQKEEWGVAKGKQKISLPPNTPFKRAGDDRDDRLRLFYVALTRAKNRLCLVSYEKEEEGRNLTPLEFLSDLKAEKIEESVDEEAVKNYFFSPYSPPFCKKERDFLLPLVKQHKLSATGLNRYLDTTEGGPQNFLEENILRFPKKKAPPLSYGTAVHNTIMEMYVEAKKAGGFPKKEKLLKFFENYLSEERLSERDFEKLLEQGKEEIAFFYKNKRREFSLDHLIEKNFKDEKCFIESIEITGKIDKIIKKDGEITVSDFKTGNPLKDWKGKNEYEKIKLWRCKNQLVFYKLLIETSKEFKGKYFMSSGSLEFIKPTKEGELATLFLEIKEEDEERLRHLIKIVGEKIKKLEFPSVEEYKKSTVKEIRRFEEDLLAGKI